MKNYKIFTLAAFLLVLAACDKEKEFVLPGGLDASKPAVASLSYDEGIIKVSWDPTPFAESYTLEYKPASSGDWLVISDLAVTSYTLSSLLAETTYDVRVKAIWGEKVSEYASSTATTPVSKAEEERKAAEEAQKAEEARKAAEEAARLQAEQEAEAARLKAEQENSLPARNFCYRAERPSRQVLYRRECLKLRREKNHRENFL